MVRTSAISDKAAKMLMPHPMASAQPADHHMSKDKCSEDGMKSANEAMQKMTDATRKAAVMTEIDKAREMMAKKDDKGCATQMGKVMAMMSDTDNTSDTGMMSGKGPMMDMQMMTPGPDDSASTNGYKSAMMTMMQSMPMMKFTGNADIDFMTQMRTHHQGAIDMAKVVLANGKDAKVRKLASNILKAQQREIATIDAWLKVNGTSSSH